ncbi:MAG: LLM class F420-dependent oxidoreductase [Chloroflexus sp.]|uniref:LLM class F420-dependent oxidoreductase n=1 Tax=Chloroflexus sp. TaxID=1904827 RepID=UPI0021DF001F|nr:LLM class F420-dependent oxidoreductase [Chloroflexus sp.]GIV88937.1 MAG: LLM class F420-dependent oxidoreductase [Chloroflexus sp.]GIV88945.1 MAG: LLM class F420-dependent oxidoreductase [Chloroflexus sp.]
MPIKIALMIEGQNGLTWPRWQRLAQATEDLGFVGLYRSDHFTNATPPEKESLELWISLAWLASHTKRIEFGPLVSPVSFRHPALTARMAAAVDDLSGGRLQLGLGAGWQEREHTMFGFDLLPVQERFHRFAEGLEVVTRLLRSETPITWIGEYYQLRDAILLPRPQRPGGPPIVIGGNGEKRTLPLTARYADEWNAVFVPPDRFAQLNAKLDELLATAGRPRAAVRRSVMTGSVFGRDDAEVERVLAGRDRATLRARGVLVGTAGEVIEQIHAFAAVGVEWLMVQWLDVDDLDRLEAFATQVLPHVG